MLPTECGRSFNHGASRTTICALTSPRSRQRPLRQCVVTRRLIDAPWHRTGCTGLATIGFEPRSPDHRSDSRLHRLERRSGSASEFVHPEEGHEMRMGTLMHSSAAVCVVLILATPIARAYIHGGNTGQSPDRPSRPVTPTTTVRWEEAGVIASGAHDPSSASLPRAASAPTSEPATCALVSLGLLALGASVRKRRGPDAPSPLARFQVSRSR